MRNMILYRIRLMVIPLLLLTVVLACNKSTTSADQQNQGPGGTIYQDISVADARTMILENQNNPDFVILDVRTRSEFDSGHIENAVNLDFYADTFEDDLDALDKTKTYLVYCRTGNRSGQATDIMRYLNFEEVYDMLGGISEWIASGYPVVN